MKPERHILGVSGGRDSAALAVHLRETRPELPLDYFFTDTGKELPEVYSFLDRLEGFLGRRIHRLNPERDFDFWLREYKHFLPSPRTRWCTRQLKLRPLEQWLRDDLDQGVIVHSYVAIRADESGREGYQATHPNMRVHFPLKDAGIDRQGVIELLEGAGVGEPAYYRWRSRSGCTFCFFQQKIEWVRLLREHPDEFAIAQAYEKSALSHGSPFTWSHGESLEDLARPDRVKAIEEEFAKRRERALSARRRNPLATAAEPSVDDLYGVDEASAGCITCHK